MKKTRIWTFLAALAVFGLLAALSACNNGNNSTGGGAATPDTPAEPRPFRDISAAELVSEIKMGVNLACALDSSGLTRFSANPTLAEMETAGGLPVTTTANITAWKNAGFNAIRIPVTWHKAIDRNNTIRPDFMARVTEVVNSAVENDMYILLNTHHDEKLFGLLDSNVEASLVTFRKIWGQIADNFKNYNEKLIFEALNEPTTPDSPLEWEGGTAEERANLNRYYQAFVDVVRASGGNNNKRMLMVTPSAAHSYPVSLNGLALPEDTVPAKLIVSIHEYMPGDFCFPVDEMPWAVETSWSRNNPADTKPITDPIDLAYNTFVSKGIPVIMGEFGAGDKANTAARVDWAEYYVSYAKDKGIPCFWWDTSRLADPGLLNRSNNTFFFPEIVNALMRGAGVSAPPPPYSSDTAFTLVSDESGWQFQYRNPSLLGGGKIEQGAAYTFTYSFRSSAAMDFFGVNLVDYCNYTNWTELSDSEKVQNNIAANTVVSGSVTITATGTATNTTPGANMLHFQAGPGTKSAPALTFTTFELKKN